MNQNLGNAKRKQTIIKTLHQRKLLDKKLKIEIQKPRFYPQSGYRQSMQRYSLPGHAMPH